MSDARNLSFAENPDFPEEHEPRWHQWGILTHTKKFAEYYRTEAQANLKSMGIDEKVAALLAERIGDWSKEDLLKISMYSS